MGTRSSSWRLPVGLVLALLGAGPVAGAGHQVSEPTVVRGHVYDAFGRGIRVDVCAYRRDTGLYPTYERGAFSSAENGSYEISLRSDYTYRLTAIDGSTSIENNCQEGSHGPIWHEISSIYPFRPPEAAGTSVDFALKFWLHGWLDYNLAGYARPGGTVRLSAQIAEAAGPVTVEWTDPLATK